MDDLSAVIGRYQRAIIDQSADDLAGLYAVDAVHELPFLFPGMPARYDGREAVRAAYRAVWVASDAHPHAIENVVVHRTSDPEVAVVEQVVVGVMASTGRPFAFPGILVFRIRDGQIIQVRDYLDGLAVAHATGQLPAVAAALAVSEER